MISTHNAQTAPGAIMRTISGMSNNDNAGNFWQAGALYLWLEQNQIQEATVVSTGYSGQFGGAAGGNMNYVTKSGSNQLHGNAQYYWNGRALNPNDWFLKTLGKPRPFDDTRQCIRTSFWTVRSSG